MQGDPLCSLYCTKWWLDRVRRLCSKVSHTYNSRGFLGDLGDIPKLPVKSIQLLYLSIGFSFSSKSGLNSFFLQGRYPMRFQMSGGELHGVSCGRAKQLPVWIVVQWCLCQGGHCRLQQGTILKWCLHWEGAGGTPSADAVREVAWI